MERVPISDLQTRPAEILAGLSKGPVTLTQHDEPAAVLISPEHYNRIVATLENLQDALDAQEARRDTGDVRDFDDYLTSWSRA